MFNIGDTVEAVKKSWRTMDGAVVCEAITVGEKYQVTNTNVSLLSGETADGKQITPRDGLIEVVNDNGEEDLYPPEAFVLAEA